MINKEVFSEEGVKLAVRIATNIENTPAEQVKEDMKTLLLVLVEFIEREEPRILKKETTENELIKSVIKLVTSTGVEFMSPFGRKEREKKYSGFKLLLPMMAKYNLNPDELKLNENPFKILGNE